MTGADAGRLRRTLGLGDAVTIGLGSMVGAGVFAVWGPATGAAGGAVLLALLLAGVVATCNALSSAALAARYPSAGGTYVYGRERLGPLWGYLAGWCFVVGKTASCAAMALTAAAYLVPVPGAERVAAIVAVLVVTGLNLVGVRRSAQATQAIVGVVAAVLLGVVAAAWWPTGDGASGQLDAISGPHSGVGGILQGAALLFFAFAGYARIATLGEEVRDPQRVIPRAVVLALGGALLLYLLVGVTVLGVLGVESTAGSTTPVADAAAVAWGGAQWSWVVRAAAGVAALGALLNLVLGISRTSVAMARDGHLPGALATLDGPDRVPRVAELTVGGVVLVVVLAADLRGAIAFSSFGVLLYYAVANLSALSLAVERRQTWLRFVGAVGLVGCLALAVSLPWSALLGGSVLLLAGLVGYVLTRPRDTAG